MSGTSLSSRLPGRGLESGRANAPHVHRSGTPLVPTAQQPSITRLNPASSPEPPEVRELGWVLGGTRTPLLAV